jgi:putative membrane protein
MKMPRRIALVASLAACFAFAAAANEDEHKHHKATTDAAQPQNLDDDMEESASAGEETITDAKFFERTASANMLEVKLGKVAAERATSAEIKAFGERMVADHGKKIDELEALAAKKNVTLPLEMLPQHKAECDRIEAFTGSEFDEAYADFMVRAHRDMENLLRKTAETTQDNDIRTFANETIKGVQAHYAHAQKIDAIEVTAGVEDDDDD